MMLSIKHDTLWSSRDLELSYFHPRACRHRMHNDSILMTLQTISGSDYFGPVLFSWANSVGVDWTPPALIPGMGRIPATANIEEGVCDVVPDYHPNTGSVLAIGHNVYYRENRLYDSLSDWEYSYGPSLQRYIVYTVMDQHGVWSGIRHRLEFPDFAECSMFSCGCSQKVVLPDGNILIPVTFGFFGRKDRMVCSLLCSFDGQTLRVLKRGNILENPVGRGLLEPSLVEFGAKYYLTLRAEDERGYVAVSDDGLNWHPAEPWQWANGQPLIMSTTQQHWLKLGGKLYLVYTRKNGRNNDVMRWRSPLLMAEFDPERRCLIKESEQVVFPMSHDPENLASVALMGNFHPLDLSATDAIVTVGEMLPEKGFSGNTLLAVIRARRAQSSSVTYPSIEVTGSLQSR